MEFLTMDTHAQIGLIIPSSNRLTEPQFQRYAPPEVGVHITRLRMTGRYHSLPQTLERPLPGLRLYSLIPSPELLSFIALRALSKTAWQVRPPWWKLSKYGWLKA
ncbi:MAG: hypothetical protein HY694_17145 [Deltaproteobacteria bacterium]|nr:hypothetical protein [Deltaproteobacteria bacterium]